MKSIKLTSPPYDFEKAFRAAKKDGVQILLVLSSPLFAPHSKEIVDLSMRYQLPTMFTFKYYVEAGGLMSYGVDTEPLYRRGAAFVAKTLRGATASDLPVEQASKQLRAYRQFENRQSSRLHVADFNLAPRQRGNRIGERMSAFGT